MSCRSSRTNPRLLSLSTSLLLFFNKSPDHVLKAFRRDASTKAGSPPTTTQGRSLRQVQQAPPPRVLSFLSY